MVIKHTHHHWYAGGGAEHFLWTYLMLTIFIVFLLLTLLLYKYWKHVRNNKKAKMNKEILIYSVCGMIFYLLSSIFFLVGEMLHDSYGWVGYPYPFVAPTWGTANIFAYLLYINRLKVTFTNTVYETRRCYFIVFYILITIFAMSQITESILAFLAIYGLIDIGIQQLLFIATFGTDLVIDFIMSTILLYLFIKKLFAVTLNNLDFETEYAMTPTFSSKSNDSVPLTLNVAQKKLLLLVVKQFTLTIFGLIATQIYIAWNGPVSGFLYSDQWTHLSYDAKYGIYVIDVMLFSHDCILNGLSMLLNFAVTKSWYFRLCWICNKINLYLCRKFTEYRINKLEKSSPVYMKLNDETNTEIYPSNVQML